MKIIKHNYSAYRMLMVIAILTNILLHPLHAQEEVRPGEKIVVGQVTFKDNKVTKDNILRRELMFSSGDTLEKGQFLVYLDKSRENLLNTSLFNFVDTATTTHGDDPRTVDVLFTFTERWYIWPWPIIEFADRNFNTWWNENRDLSRMSYGIDLRWENFRGRKELLKFKLRFGYNEQYGFEYSIPYLDRKKTLGLSIGAGYGRTHEVAVINRDDQPEYYKDEEEYIMKRVGAHLNLHYRKEIYNSHSLRMEYEYRSYADTISFINPNFIPGGEDKMQYFSLMYHFRSDHRDFKAYPLQGYFIDIGFIKRGFGLFENGAVDLFYVEATFRKYVKMSRRWFFASGFKTKFSNNAQQPFDMDRAIGYGQDVVRAYGNYVVNGHNFGILKNNFKFAIIPENSFNIPFIKSKKFGKVHYAFYINAFLDLGYADQFYPIDELNNKLENTLLVGYGLGLDFVTYYDVVMRFEYSFNKSGENGFFINFMAPI